MKDEELLERARELDYEVGAVLEDLLDIGINHDDPTDYPMKALDSAQEKIMQLIKADREVAVREALEKHHPAKLVAGVKKGLYEILDRVDDDKPGHVKNLRVACLRCGELMYRPNNRLAKKHRNCDGNIAQLQSHQPTNKEK